MKAAHIISKNTLLSGNFGRGPTSTYFNGGTMKISMFLSVENTDNYGPMFIGRQAALACASEKFAANVVPYFSSLSYGEGSDNFHIESGCRIDLLSVSVNRFDDVLYLWKRFQDLFGIHCVWLDIAESGPGLGYKYSGCITDWWYYRTNSNLIHGKALSCNCDVTSDEVVLTEADLRTRFKNRPRNGKPLS